MDGHGQQGWSGVSRGRRARGSAIVFFAVTVTACLAFAVLAIDVGLIILTRIQLQNAADASALAGASALRDLGEDEARARAIAVAGENVAWRVGFDPVVITNADVTFPEPGQCRVRTHRTFATGDPLRTFFIKTINPLSNRLAQASAVAVAEWYYVCGTSCVKPWSVPDRWDDLDNDNEYDYEEPYQDVNMNGSWDPGEPFDDLNSNGSWDPEEPYDPFATGYLPPADTGLRISLKLGDSNDVIVPGFFYAVDLPPLHSPLGPPQTGASIYEWNIAECSPYQIDVGDSLQVEPGNMVGPTTHGAQDLIASDPGAYWDPLTQSVQGSNFGTSPREIKIGFFDPRYTPKSGRNYVIVSKLGAFFIESVANQSTVTGVFMGLGTTGEPCDPNMPGQFLTALRLVQ